MEEIANQQAASVPAPAPESSSPQPASSPQPNNVLSFPEKSPSSTGAPATPPSAEPASQPSAAPAPPDSNPSSASSDTQNLQASIQILTSAGKKYSFDFDGNSGDVAAALRNIQALGYTEFTTDGMTIIPFHTMSEIKVAVTRK